MATKTYQIIQNDIALLSITIEVDGITDPYIDYQWDSKTGLVTAALATNPTKRVIIPHTGNSLGAIEPGSFKITNATAVDYNYWYY